VAPELSGGFGDLVAKRWTDRWVAEGRWRSPGAARDLLVRVPNLPARLVHVEPGAAGEAFFAITDRLPDRRAAAAAPARVAIAWDASGSRDREATERELAFLERLMAAWPSTAFDVVVFRDAPERPAVFEGRDGRGRLSDALRRAPRDGGTALAGLSFARSALPAAGDALWLLFSDGIGTLGEALPALGDVPVWTVTGAAVADRALLRHVSRSTGGELLDLASMDPSMATAALATPGVRLVGASGPEGSVADLQSIERADRSRAIVIGRLLAPEAEVTLAFGDGAGIVERRAVRVRRTDAVLVGDGPGPIATAWAQGRVELLGLFPDRNADALLSVGRRFGLVTAGTSLLVLETLEQHLEHGVEPSATRPELRERYLAAVGSREKSRKQGEREQLDRVAALWSARVAWWKEDHSVPPGWRWSDDEPRKGRHRGGDFEEPLEERRMFERESASDAPRSAPAPMAAASAPAIMAMDGSGGRAMAKKAEAPGEAGVEAQIVIKPWDPQTPWTEALRRAPPGSLYETYLGQRQVHASPAFFLDCAGFFLRQNQRALGLRILSNLAELRIDDAALLRVFAWRLQEAGALEEAVEVLTKVLRLRPEDGQSRRDLALALGDLGEARGRPADVARATELLWTVVRTPGQRTAEIELIALMELNRLAARAERRGWADPAKAANVDGRLRGNLDLDLRVSLSWDADNTDVDLHLFEPTGEHAFYGHAQTQIGGLVSRDVTNGYGPEEYVVRRAVPGPYAVKAHYYGSGQQTLVGPATLTATVFTNWGRPDEKRQLLTLRLESPREMEQIGVVTMGGRGGKRP
jgi:hypothetical protein